jgi:two-component system, OmpR family, phosphate regulon response regulator PhoB
MATVLVVDDDPHVVTVVRRILEQEGFGVAIATNGAECLLALEARRPDLLLLDIAMPVLDGFQVLRLLKEKPETRDLPVIMLTARSSGDDVARSLLSGADFYLTKPFEAEELVVAVRRVLEVSGPPAAGEGPALDYEV